MFSRVKIAIRFFFLGLAVGVLLAPRSGEETRRMFREKADRLLNDILDAASLGTTSGTSGSAGSPPTEEAAAPRAARTTNGSGTRSRRSSSSTSDKSESEAEAEATNASA